MQKMFNSFINFIISISRRGLLTIYMANQVSSPLFQEREYVRTIGNVSCLKFMLRFIAFLIIPGFFFSFENHVLSAN